MEITIKKTISKETLEDIFVTAIEGGSNYWYLVEKDAIQKIRNAVPDTSVPFSVALFQAVYDHDVEVEMNDLENPEDVLGIISKKTMQERLQKSCEVEANIQWAIEAEMNKEGDAVSSDLIFQVITLGEVQFG